MEDVLRKIQKADEDEIDQILTATLKRYAVLFPDWEICTLSVEKNKDRAKQIDNTIAMLESMKKRC